MLVRWTNGKYRTLVLMLDPEEAGILLDHGIYGYGAEIGEDERLREIRDALYQFIDDEPPEKR